MLYAKLLIDILFNFDKNLFMTRYNNRKNNVLRPIKIKFNAPSYAAGSVIYQQGRTKVLCCVTMQVGVPAFLRNKGTGWLHAEYSMLPTATMPRTQREIKQSRPNGRSLEISRLIGRSFRTIVDLSSIGERTIYIDCDVLQADGGTRVSSISGAMLALQKAEKLWLEKGIIADSIIKDRIAAVSVGIKEDETILIDPDFAEDTQLVADLNMVLTASGKVVEVQGGAEKEPMSWELFDQARTLVCKQAETIFALSQELEDPALVGLSKEDKLKIKFAKRSIGGV
jgi:ribonuclease PH